MKTLLLWILPGIARFEGQQAVQHCRKWGWSRVVPYSFLHSLLWRGNNKHKNIVLSHENPDTHHIHRNITLYGHIKGNKLTTQRQWGRKGIKWLLQCLINQSTSLEGKGGAFLSHDSRHLHFAGSRYTAEDPSKREREREKGDAITGVGLGFFPTKSHLWPVYCFMFSRQVGIFSLLSLTYALLW